MIVAKNGTSGYMRCNLNESGPPSHWQPGSQAGPGNRIPTRPISSPTLALPGQCMIDITELVTVIKMFHHDAYPGQNAVCIR